MKSDEILLSRAMQFGKLITVTENGLIQVILALILMIRQTFYSEKNCFVGQVNNMLCTLGKMDSFVLNRLFKAYRYCCSFYGCELWDLDNKQINDLCIAWRKGLRRVRRLPNTTKGDILAVMSDSICV